MVGNEIRPGCHGRMEIILHQAFRYATSQPMPATSFDIYFQAVYRKSDQCPCWLYPSGRTSTTRTVSPSSCPHPTRATHFSPRTGILKWMVADKRKFFRSFVIMQYRKQARITRAHHTNHGSGAFCNDLIIKVPWMQLAQENNKWLSKGSAPHDYLILEPLKMDQVAIDVVFYHWITRAKQGLMAFSFIHSSLLDKSRHRLANEHICEGLVSPEVPLANDFGVCLLGTMTISLLLPSLEGPLSRSSTLWIASVKSSSSKSTSAYEALGFLFASLLTPFVRTPLLCLMPFLPVFSLPELEEGCRQESRRRNTCHKLCPSTLINDEEYEGSTLDQGADSNNDSSNSASDSGFDNVSPKGKGRAKPKTQPKPRPKPCHIPPSLSQDSFDKDDLRYAKETSLRKHHGQEKNPGGPSGHPRLPSL